MASAPAHLEDALCGACLAIGAVKEEATITHSAGNERRGVKCGLYQKGRVRPCFMNHSLSGTVVLCIIALV